MGQAKFRPPPDAQLRHFHPIFLKLKTKLIVCSGQLSLLTTLSTLSEMKNDYYVADYLLIWAVVCLHAAPRVQLFAGADSGWPRNPLRYH